MSVRNVYDSDLLEHPVLKEIAVEYALNYRGNFDFMIQAKMLAQQAELNPAIMRAILNCLKYDAEQYDLWKRVCDIVRPKRPNLYVVDDQYVDEYDDDDRPVIPVTTARRSTPSKHKGEEHSCWVYTDALIKAPFGVASGAIHMRVLHRPDPYAEIEWKFPLNDRAIAKARAGYFYPSWPKDYLVGHERVPTDLRIRWLCGRRPSWSSNAALLMGDINDLIPTMAARPCRVCTAVYNGEEV